MIDIILIAFFFCLRLFVFGPWLEYGIDRQLTKYTHGSASVAISSKMGVLLKLKYVHRKLI
jgi:hypothetical protein